MSAYIFGEVPVIIMGNTDAGKTRFHWLLLNEFHEERPPVTSAIDHESEKRIGGMPNWNPVGVIFGNSKLCILDCPGNEVNRCSLEKDLKENLKKVKSKDIKVFYCVDGTKLFGSDEHKREIQCRVRADMDMTKRLLKKDDGIDKYCSQFYIIVTRFDQPEVKLKTVDDVQGKLGKIVTKAFQDVGGSEKRIFLLDLLTKKGFDQSFEQIKNLF